MKTLTELRDRPFYRFLKVLYFLFFLPLGFMVYMGYQEQQIVYLAWVFGVLFVLEIFKRVIYYIFLGSFVPEK